jgi:pyruvate kinase
VYIFTGDAVSTRAEALDSFTQLKEPAHICVDRYFFKKIKKGSTVKVVDVNGKKACITITELDKRHAEGVIDKKVYLDASSKLSLKGNNRAILNIDSQVEPIRLFKEDLLVITERDELGRSAKVDENGELIKPARISCSFKGIAVDINVGESVFIDDGKIGLEVVEKGAQSIKCRVKNAKASGTLLKEEKGINFPQTNVKTAAITDTDRKNILAVIDFADHLSVSFCQNAKDISDLQDLLIHKNRSDIGIIAKIETQQAVTQERDTLVSSFTD